MKKSKLVKLSALVMAIAMLVSMSMIQAYGETRGGTTSNSTTVSGYSVRTTISIPSGSYFKLRTLSDTTMNHDMTLNGTYKNSATGNLEHKNAYTTYNGYDVSHNFYGSTGYDLAYSATGKVVSYYNGISGTTNVSIF